MTPVTTAPTVAIRAARGSDGPALERLAALDSATVPAGRLLVAEADGELVAALGADTGVLIADPFHHTGGVVALLELQAGHGRAPARRGVAAWLGLRPGLHARAA